MSSDIRRRTVDGLQQGDSFTVVRTMREEDTRAFGDLTRDRNPVHYDDRFASSKGLRGRICHGLLVGSLVTEIGGQIGWLASRMEFRFRAPVYFGDTVSCRLTISDIDARERARARAVITNQRGEIVLEATLAGHLPRAAERAILEELLASGG